MSRKYVTTYSGTITAAGTDSDIFTSKPAANKPLYLRRLILSQTSEVGDAQEENLEFEIIYLPATVTDGSGGAAVTPDPVDENDSAAGFTCRANDTTLATTSGTSKIKSRFSWNERNTPLERVWEDLTFAPRCQNGEALAVRLLTTLADDMSGVFEAVWEEF